MSAISLDNQIASVLREIRMRESVYPRWIGAGKMTAEKSAHELACMRAALSTLQQVRDAQQPEHQPVSEPTEPYRQAIMGAVARAWCHPLHSHKEMDASLAETITNEVLAINRSEPTDAQSMSEDYIRGYDAGFIVGAEKGRSGPTEAQIEEYEILCNGELVAGANGPGARAEILHYLTQYEQDGPCEAYAVTRRLVDRAALAAKEQPE